MTELEQGVLGTIALLISVVFSTLAWFGGRSEAYFSLRARLWKRLIAPLFFTASVILLSLYVGSFTYFYLLSIPLFFISSIFGYGGNDIWTKMKRRFLWYLLRIIGLSAFAIDVEAALFISQIVTGFIVTIAIGLKNPVKAPLEEGIINFSTVFLVPFYVL